LIIKAAEVDLVILAAVIIGSGEIVQQVGDLPVIIIAGESDEPVQEDGVDTDVCLPVIFPFQIGGGGTAKRGITG
jgi:hypothetical protein